MNCRKEIFELLENLFINDVDISMKAFIDKYGEKEFILTAEEIKQAIREENILKIKEVTQFGLSSHFSDIKEILSNSVHGMTLEVTQECNLRCGYCIYQDHHNEKRNFSPESMGVDTAYKAIDFFYTHSEKSEEISFGFYGGEPLLRFPFIQDCVEYANKIFSGKKLFFNLTTNAVLLTEEIAEYLLKENFSILVSIDGPKEIHDIYRKDKYGIGSFDRTLAGLKILADKHRELEKGKITINIVYTPPYSVEKLDEINNYFNQIEWLSDVDILINYPSNNSIPNHLINPSEKKENIKISKWTYEKYRENFESSDSIVKKQIEKRYSSFIQRPVLNEVLNKFALNGCCLPGQRKNFVSTDGSIHICEKISSFSPKIGNVNTGFDFDKIKKIYINDYAKKSIGVCSKCWALRLCDICYIHAFDEHGNFDLNKKNKFCISNLKTMEKSLIQFITLLNRNPGKMDYLYNFDIK